MLVWSLRNMFVETINSFFNYKRVMVRPWDVRFFPWSQPEITIFLSAKRWLAVYIHEFRRGKSVEERSSSLFWAVMTFSLEGGLSDSRSTSAPRWSRTNIKFLQRSSWTPTLRVMSLTKHGASTVIFKVYFCCTFGLVIWNLVADAQGKKTM